VTDPKTKPADLPDHWDPTYEPTQAELEGSIGLPEGVTPEEALRAILAPTPNTSNTGKPTAATPFSNPPAGGHHPI